MQSKCHDALGRARRCAWLIVVAVSLTVVGCAMESSEAAPRPTSQSDYDDVAQALGAVVTTSNQGGELGSITDATSIAIGAPRFGLVVGTNGTIMGKRGELTYAYTAHCRDAEGHPLDFCDNNAAAGHVMVSWSGTLTTPLIKTSIGHHAELDFSDLHADPVHISGSGGFELDAVFQSRFNNLERAYRLSYDAEYEDLSVARSPMDVLSGSVRYVIDAERMSSGSQREIDAVFHLDAVLVFRPDGTAELTLDGSHHYLIDTQTGIVEKPI